MFEKYKQRQKQKSITYFDEIAHDDDIIPEPARCYQIMMEELSDRGKMKLADIGCGTGEMLLLLKKRFGDRPGISLYGVDLSKKSLEYAQEKCGNTVTFVCADAEALPFEKETFDVLLCMHSFHHYPSPMKALKEMRRVLKTGGSLYIVENDHEVSRRIRINIKIILGKLPGDIWMYSRRRLARMVRRSRFQVEKHEHIAQHSQFIAALKKD